MNFGIDDEIRNIQNAMRRRDGAELAMERERSVGLVTFLLIFFGPAVFETFIAGIGAGAWALAVTVIILLGRAALDFILRLFGARYGFSMSVILFIVPISIFFSGPMLFGAGSEMGLSLMQCVAAAAGFPAIVIAALYLRREVSPLDNYMDEMQRRG